jgi:hypothetical protein
MSEQEICVGVVIDSDSLRAIYWCKPYSTPLHNDSESPILIDPWRQSWVQRNTNESFV